VVTGGDTGENGDPAAVGHVVADAVVLLDMGEGVLPAPVTGQGLANPIGAVGSAALMLEHFGLPDQAARLNKAVEATTAARLLTRDVGGTATKGRSPRPSSTQLNPGRRMRMGSPSGRRAGMPEGERPGSVRPWRTATPSATGSPPRAARPPTCAGPHWPGSGFPAG
jgi:hypothetical protein